jgi:hypothetical protein
MLNELDRAFLRKRAALVRAWPIAGGIMLAALILLTAWLLWSSPFLVNPYAMMERIREGSIEPGTLQLLAGLLPVAVLCILALVAAMVAFSFAAFSNEKRHLRIIDTLLAKDR